MNISQALGDAFKCLSKKNITSAHLDAEILLAFILKSSREKILTHPEKNLTITQITKFKKLILRRARYEPIAHLIGYRFFYELPIKISSEVLIPRPETEQLVELVIDYIRKNISKNSKITILDVGTGSGCIGLALKKMLPEVKILGLELSTEALKLARQNAKNLNLDADFKKSNFLTGFKKSLQETVIVANLPYLDHQELQNFSLEVNRGLSYEPTKALFAGYHGLSAYIELFKQINQRQEKPRAIFIEIGATFWRDFFKLTKNNFPLAKILLIKDLCGKHRFIKIIL